jgi:hypothetical protein
VLSKLPSELSGGMRKRVGLAAPSSARPEILLYDEPVTGLDPMNAGVVHRLIASWPRSWGHLDHRHARHRGRAGHFRPGGAAGARTDPLRRQGLEASATRPELARAIARTDSMTIRLDAATTSLQAASASMEDLMARVNSGEGTLGRLTRDDELYERLNQAVASVNALTEDIRENPRRYINVRVF